jgi:hypothetical protein
MTAEYSKLLAEDKHCSIYLLLRISKSGYLRKNFRLCCPENGGFLLLL